MSLAGDDNIDYKGKTYFKSYPSRLSKTY